MEEFTCKQRALKEHIKITSLLRELNKHCLTLDASDLNLAILAESTEQLLKQFHALEGQKMREHFTPLLALDQGEGIQPYSPFGGFHNPISPPIHYAQEGDKMVGKVVFDINHEGPHDCVHGGVIAGVYDCILASAMIKHGLGGPTVKLDIEYVAPSPLLAELRFEAWLDRVEGKKVFLTGQCFNGTQLVSKANAIFINTLALMRKP
jgi:acyl-coenzyme A thioesterase PaaI-like protein